MSKFYTKGDVIDVKIEKIVPRGFGLGFAENLTVLVPLAARQDLLKVRIREIKKHTAFADIVEIVQPGPQRITPPCEYFGTCGGCNFQHLDYRAQLDAKAGIVRDSLQRIGKINFEGEIAIIESPQQFEYRSRARWHLDRKKQQIGYFRRDSNEIVDITACPILTPAMQSTLNDLRLSVNWESMPGGTLEIEAASDKGGRVSTYSATANGPAAEVSIDLAGENYSYTAETFFQANRFLVEKLIDTAIGDAGGDIAFDLYCGVGLFSIPLARRFKKVVGVEDGRVAVRLAKQNAETAKLENLEFKNKSVEEFLVTGKKKKPDLVLLDPPRSGTEKRTVPALTALQPPQIVYVSCDPSILARDLRILIDGGYQILSITALDMFPQTHHVETVVRLRRE